MKIAQLAADFVDGFRDLATRPTPKLTAVALAALYAMHLKTGL